MKRTTFAAACVLCPALLLAACAPQGAASASAFGDRPPMDESISASSADALPAEDGSILLAEGAVTLMLSADSFRRLGKTSSDASGLAEETALSPTPSPTPAGWSWASYSFPAWNAGWMAAGRLSPAMPSSAEQPIRSKQNVPAAFRWSGTRRLLPAHTAWVSSWRIMAGAACRRTLG